MFFGEPKYSRKLKICFISDGRLIYRLGICGENMLNSIIQVNWERETNGIFVCLFNYTADIISTVEFNHSGELLATGDKGGRVVIFQQEQEVSV